LQIDARELCKSRQIEARSCKWRLTRPFAGHFETDARPGSAVDCESITQLDIKRRHVLVQPPRRSCWYALSRCHAGAASDSGATGLRGQRGQPSHRHCSQSPGLTCPAASARTDTSAAGRCKREPDMRHPPFAQRRDAAPAAAAARTDGWHSYAAELFISMSRMHGVPSIPIAMHMCNATYSMSKRSSSS